MLAVSTEGLRAGRRRLRHQVGILVIAIGARYLSAGLD
jgi:hypothetical protein